MASGSRRRLAALAIAATVSMTACSAAAPTPIILLVTPAPTPSPIIIYVTPAPTSAPALTGTSTVAPIPTPTPAATAVRTPAVTPRPTSTIAPTPRVTPTAAATIAPTPMVTPTPAATLALGSLVGNWVNVNPATSGIPELTILAYSDGTFSIHAYGACTPTYCDWGLTQLYLSASGTSAVATYTGYRSLSITLVGNQLHVISTSLAGGSTTDDYFNRG